MYSNFMNCSVELIANMKEQGNTTFFFVPEDGGDKPIGAVLVVTGERLKSFIKEFRKWEEDYLPITEIENVS